VHDGHDVLLDHDNYYVLVGMMSQWFPLFRLPREGEGKQMEPDASCFDVFDDYGVTQL
jgi:hypothetical protein